MAQTKILLDSNSYFRLARSLHPLLFVEFGEEKCCLYVLKELDDEFSRNPGLRSKFSWVSEDKYKENRGKRLALSGKQRKQTPTLIDSIRDYCLHAGRSLSRVDCAIVAYAQVLGIEIVSDDLELVEVAHELDVSAISTLTLLKRMLVCGHVDLQKVREIVSYWKYEDDCPSNVEGEYMHHFGESSPSNA